MLLQWVFAYDASLEWRVRYVQRGRRAGNKVDERGAAKAYVRRVEGVEVGKPKRLGLSTT